MPPSTRTHYLLSYDITIDSNRQRLANLLLDFGDRIQKSVFEADLDADELAKIMQLAEKLVDTDDSFRVYPLCKSCREKSLLRGRQFVPAKENFEII